MKWFKHACNLRDDPKVVLLMDKFGQHMGYSCYLKLLEYCGQNFTHSPIFHIHLKSLRHILGINSAKVQSFCDYCMELDLFKFKINGRIYEINWSYLTEIADEYSKKIRRSSGSTTNKNLKFSSLDKNKIDKKRKEELSVELEQKLLSSIRQFGRYNQKSTRAHIGENLWCAIEKTGGWTNLCSLPEKSIHWEIKKIAKLIE